VRELIDRTVDRSRRLDAAVNNASTEDRPGPVTEQSAYSYNCPSQAFDVIVKAIPAASKTWMCSGGRRISA
jgi:hypothetical protein